MYFRSISLENKEKKKQWWIYTINILRIFTFIVIIILYNIISLNVRKDMYKQTQKKLVSWQNFSNNKKNKRGKHYAVVLGYVTVKPQNMVNLIT